MVDGTQTQSLDSKLGKLHFANILDKDTEWPVVIADVFKGRIVHVWTVLNHLINDVGRNRQ